VSRACSRTVVAISGAAPLGRLDRGKSDALFGTSSGCRPRKSPLASKGAFALLRDERKRKGLSTKLDGRDRTPLLAGWAKRPYTTTGLHGLVTTAAKRAGIDKPVSPHWLRHSFATLAAVGGAPPYQPQADLGHARLETSQRYVHWARGLADSAVGWLLIRRFARGGEIPDVCCRHASPADRAPAFQAGCRGFDSRLPLHPALDVTTHASRGPPKGGLLLFGQVVVARLVSCHTSSNSRWRRLMPFGC
jgi:hypothetical protein